MSLRKIEESLPDWLWNPKDDWSRWKGFGRIGIFTSLMVSTSGGLWFVDWSKVREDLSPRSKKIFTAGLFSLLLGVLMYGVGLLGLRMEMEQKRKDQ